MTIIKSFSVGNGDMFYIHHDSDNFTVIDCCLRYDVAEAILKEIKELQAKKQVTRVISTHPDDDHIRGLELFEKEIGVRNFYCVKNSAIKTDSSESFDQYCALRDDAKKTFHIFKGCLRKWMNQGDNERGASGINILWPDVENSFFKKALLDAEIGLSPNNISAVVKYSLAKGVTALWMGDLETEFMRNIEEELELPSVDILFAPHHGRDSGRIPTSMLTKMNPKIIVVGEAPSEHLHYYPNYNTITQNSAGDIVFDCREGKVHIFTSLEYEVDFLKNENWWRDGMYYIGTLNL